MLLALHATAGDPDQAELFAASVIASWQALADQYGFIVVAPASTADNGAWGTAPGTDDDEISAVLANVQSSYDIELDRVYVWGFSAGGNYSHAIALSNPSSVAAYAVNAGVLGAYAPLVPSAAMVRIIPLSAMVGVNDPLLPEMQNDEQIFISNGWVLNDTLIYSEFSDGTPPGGHTYTLDQLATHWAYMCPYAVSP
jgi:poly(3-hydroxybutyrate) depolymerase